MAEYYFNGIVNMDGACVCISEDSDKGLTTTHGILIVFRGQYFQIVLNFYDGRNMASYFIIGNFICTNS